VDQSVTSFMRRAKGKDPATADFVVVAANFTPVPRTGYRVGVPRPGFYNELLNSDSDAYGGSNMGNRGGLPADAIPWQEQPYSLLLTLPPLSIVFLKPATALPAAEVEVLEPVEATVEDSPSPLALEP
jgi:1,4-alpha-glucan branching enzyme